MTVVSGEGDGVGKQTHIRFGHNCHYLKSLGRLELLDHSDVLNSSVLQLSHLNIFPSIISAFSPGSLRA